MAEKGRSNVTTAVVCVSAATTVVVALLELLNRFVLQLVVLNPDLRIMGTIWTIGVAVTSMGQLSPRLRRWPLGIAVAVVGSASFYGLHWVANSGSFSPTTCDLACWFLPIAYGLLFGGLGWAATSVLVTFFDKRSLNDTAPAQETPESAGGGGFGSGDIQYVVFCRIHGIEMMTAPQVAAAVKSLTEVARQWPRSYSSVYGRFVIVPQHVEVALSAAQQLLQDAGAAGVRLAVGVARGPVVPSKDIHGPNVVGPPINLAARLAFVRDGEGQVAVDEEVCRDALGAELNGHKRFTTVIPGQVKHTKLSFAWLLERPPVVVSQPIAEHSSRVETAHVVVYDVAGFSRLKLPQLVTAVAGLHHAADSALKGVGFNVVGNEEGRYAPAGDGGVVVFAQARQAWLFADALLDHAGVHKLEIRVGITTGQVVFVKNAHPVGTGILMADALSAKPESGNICLSKGFFDHLGGVAPSGWLFHPKDEHAGVFFAHRRGSGPPESWERPNGEHNPLRNEQVAEVARPERLEAVLLDLLKQAFTGEDGCVTFAKFCRRHFPSFPESLLAGPNLRTKFRELVFHVCQDQREDYLLFRIGKQFPLVYARFEPRLAATIRHRL